MNGKQAKRLRRAAMGLAVTMAEAGRDIKRDGYTVKKHRGTSPLSVMSDAARETGAVEPVPTSYQLLVRKDSLKGIYKHLKTAKA